MDSRLSLALYTHLPKPAKLSAIVKLEIEKDCINRTWTWPVGPAYWANLDKRPIILMAPCPWNRIRRSTSRRGAGQIRDLSFLHECLNVGIRESPQTLTNPLHQGRFLCHANLERGPELKGYW